VTGFAFVAKQTGDAGDLAKGDQVFAAGVNSARLGTSRPAARPPHPGGRAGSGLRGRTGGAENVPRRSRPT
jgi:hypothetical protein